MKFLLFSLLVLAGLILYSAVKTKAPINNESSFNAVNVEQDEENSNPVFLFLNNAGNKIQELSNNFFSGILMKPDTEKKEVVENDEYTNNILPEVNISIEGIENKEEIKEPEPEVETDSSTYKEPFTIILPEDLKIPSSVNDIEFRKDNIYVFAKEENVKLYETPILEGEEALTLNQWDQCLRVGISKDCCYQLVTPAGRVLYADGTLFLRHRDDMPVSENISVAKERISLPVEYISQFPTLPKGAEVTSLAMALNTIGFEVSKDDLARDFLPKGKVSETNFYESFAGDPTSRSAVGCFAGAIVKAADAYLESVESSLKAVDYTGSSFSALLGKVKEGKPVIIWITENLDEAPKPGTELIADGEYLQWKEGAHCVLLSGYDSINNVVLYVDPMRGYLEADMGLFVKRYKQLYSQAVILEETASDIDG